MFDRLIELLIWFNVTEPIILLLLIPGLVFVTKFCVDVIPPPNILFWTTLTEPDRCCMFI